ncbi:MAG: glycerophosphodiester phosphodiesterase [Candidatus Heimdallarchaeaceae archaeon]
MESDFPLIIAHRGASKDAYENSYSAFELAVKQKADMIELDTHLTSDGYFVVHHDPVISYQNQSFTIKDITLEVLDNIRLPNGEKIPLLSDTLEKFLPSIAFNIEVKCPIERKQFDELLNGVGGDCSKIIVSSFNANVLTELKEKKLGYSLAFLYTFPWDKPYEMAKRKYVDALNPYYRFLTKKRVQKYHALKKSVYTWTINGKKHTIKALKKQVNGIITDQPKETRELVMTFRGAVED